MLYIVIIIIIYIYTWILKLSHVTSHGTIPSKWDEISFRLHLMRFLVLRIYDHYFPMISGCIPSYLDDRYFHIFSNENVPWYPKSLPPNLEYAPYENLVWYRIYLWVGGPCLGCLLYILSPFQDCQWWLNHLRPTFLMFKPRSATIWRFP